MAPAVTVARCGYAKGCPSYQRSWAHRVRRLVLSGLAAASYAYCTEPAAFARPSGSPAAPELNVVPAPLGCVAMLPARGAGGHRVPCPRDRSARCSQGCSTCWMPTSASSIVASAASARPVKPIMALQIQGLGFIFVAGPMALVALLMSCLEPGCSLIVSLAGDVILALRVLRAPLRRRPLCAPF